MPTITGKIYDQVGAPSTAVDVLIRPANAGQVIKAAPNVELGAHRWSGTSVPDPITLEAGVWVVVVSTTQRANRELLFPPQSFVIDLTTVETISWAAIYDGVAAFEPGTIDTTDQAIAAKVTDPASATSDALSATFATVAAAGKPVAATLQAAADTVTKTAHGLAAGNRVIFNSITGITGLTEGTTYYVLGGSTANTFKVAATENGAAVDLGGVDGTANYTVQGQEITGEKVFRTMPKIKAFDSHYGNADAQVIGKAPGSGTTGTWEAWHEDTQGNIVHFNCGPGMVGNANAAALFGLGCDFEGTGIYLHNRLTGGGGIGLRVGMDQNLTWAGSRGIQVTNGSGAGIGAEFIQSPGSTIPGPAVKVWAQISVSSSQKLMEWHKANTTSAGIRVGYVSAGDGSLNWDASVRFTADTTATVPLLITGLSGQTANLQDWSTVGLGTVASLTKDGIMQASYLRAQAAGAYVDLYDTGGTANQRRFAIRRVGTTLAITAKTDTNSNAASGDLLTLDHSTGNLTPRDGGAIVAGTTTGLKIGTATTQKIGFFNAAPVAKPTGVTVDAAGIHAALVSLGLIGA